nr:MAG TPA: hypothetical protein [Caudoviricetes sp.]
MIPSSGQRRRLSPQTSPCSCSLALSSPPLRSRYSSTRKRPCWSRCWY